MARYAHHKSNDECPQCCNLVCQCGVDVTCFPCAVLKWLICPPSTSTRSEAHQKWARSDSPSKENLCWVCYEYINDGIPESEWGWRDNHATAFGKSRAQNFTSHYNIQTRAEKCVFCNMVAEGLDPGYKKGIVTVEPSLGGINIERKDYGYWIGPYNLRKGFPIYMSGKSFHEFAHAQSINVVEASHINLSSAKGWLATCKSEHGKTCSETGWSSILRNPKSLRMIDVDRKLIVYPPPNCEYATLSYVWGGVNSCNIEESDPNNMNIDLKRVLGLEPLRPGETLLPQTILDSITVTKSLGLKYLWVDDLCIRGTDAEKNQQFGEMHNIYGNSEVTIIAAQAENAKEGLFGVRHGSRGPDFIEQQISLVDSDKKLIRDMPMPKDFTTSTWSTRGWCLQEQLLSRRYLVFWDNQVYWQCRSDMQFEEMPLNLKSEFVVPAEKDWYSGRYISDPNAPPPNPPVLARIAELPVEFARLNLKGSIDTTVSITTQEGGKTVVLRPELFQEYIFLVELYSQRSLTNDSDALRAVGALLTIIGQGLKTNMLYGLPECLLDSALLWRAKEPLQRRCEDLIPSWSWAAWKGQPIYDSMSEGKREDLRPFLVWSTQLKDNSTRLINKIGTGIQINQDTRPLDWDERKKVPGFHNLATSPMDSLSPMHLQMWTICCSEIIKSSISTGPQTFSLHRHQSDEPTGELTIDSVSNDDISSYTLIVLSEAQRFHSPRMNQNLRLRDYPDTFLLYNVLVVDLDRKTGIATRKGVGKVLRETWGSYQFEWKFIRLE
ncbi:hypothetical protein BP6252_12635 [Coleophoma cylindrospora]|uniref:Heterokaryon incompatibility domain-containing protein n=1 Tax=Coleophoma cylindrospora TaxID=1849047 RepID=A0A3D8QD59_9HELO|nr:hypothetical protein BP6252_12635 [Coleophoma cylindrospora]